MSQTSQTASSPSSWLAVRGADLVPGDAILVTHERRVATGLRSPQWVTEQTGKGRYPGKPKNLNVDVRMAGRVIDVRDRTIDGKEVRKIRVEFTGIGNLSELPPLTDHLQLHYRHDYTVSEISEKRRKLVRHEAHGPSDRTIEDGRAYLISLLVEAAKKRGLDPVAALAATVDPAEERKRLPGRRYEGAHLFDLGTLHASAVLDGRLPYCEWMLRQIDERLAKPSALPRDDYDPAEIEAHLASGPDEERWVEVEEIFKAVPGSSVSFVQRSGPVLVVDNSPVTASPDAPQESNQPSGVSPIKKLPPVVYDDDDEDDFVA